MAITALVASCHDCKCEDQRALHDPPALVNSLALSEGAEELVRPEERCTSWDTEAPAASLYGSERRLAFRLAPGACFGLQLAEAGQGQSSLVVMNVEPRSCFGRTIDGQPGVGVGDVLVEANGCRGSAAGVRDALQQAVASAGTRHVTLVAQPRPAAFEMELRRESPKQKLGVTAVIDKTNPSRLLVQAVHAEGLVPEWNAAHASCRVFCGDFIKEVNGVSGDAAAMIKAIQAASQQGSVLNCRVSPPGGGHAAPRQAAPRQPPSQPPCQAVHRATQLRPASVDSTGALPPRLAQKLTALALVAGLEDLGGKENSVDLDRECSEEDLRIEFQFPDEPSRHRACSFNGDRPLSPGSKGRDHGDEDGLSEASTEFPASPRAGWRTPSDPPATASARPRNVVWV